MSLADVVPRLYQPRDDVMTDDAEYYLLAELRRITARLDRIEKRLDSPERLSWDGATETFAWATRMYWDSKAETLVPYDV